MKIRRVRRPAIPTAPPSIRVAVQLFVALLVIFLLMVPFTMTAVGPLTVRVVDADKDPVPGACVTEVWPAYSATAAPGGVVDTVAHTASSTVRADSLGLARLPLRTATASGFRRLGVLVPRLAARMFGGTPRPAVSLTVLGPGYQGTAVDLAATNGTVSVAIRTDVQSPALQSRLARSCVAMAVTGAP